MAPASFARTLKTKRCHEDPWRRQASRWPSRLGRFSRPSSAASDSDWNGADGAPLPQVWDTHSHDVTGDLATGTNPVQIIDPFTSPGGDCTIGIANVLTVR